MECKHIQERLVAYGEENGDLEEKKAIEQHLSSCQLCSRALLDLKKTDEIIKRLPEVEPPAWMTKRIMARVRAEEEKKKGLLQRLFYPLRIKIPIEVFATVLVAVAAIYVFKAVEPQMKPVGPPTAPEQSIAKEEENIQKTVADFYKIKVADMFSKKRTRNLARPRQIAMALAKELTNQSLPEIGESFGGRDHTTVIHACRKVAELRETEADIGRDYLVLLQSLTG